MSIMENEYLKQLHEANKKIKKLTEALEVIATYTIIPDDPEDLKQQVCTVYNIAESALEEFNE